MPVFFVLLMFFASNHAIAIDKSRLWLPVAYEKQYNHLIDAAKKVNTPEICHELVDGTLSESHLSTKKIVFVFRCRDASRAISLVYVESNTLNVSTQDELWQQQEEEKKRQLLRKILMEKDKYWQLCETTLQESWAHFNDPSIVGKVPPRPDITSEGELVYRVEFTTISLSYKPLSYLATAVVNDVNSCSVSIKPI